jgi:hypothetical protein
MREPTILKFARRSLASGSVLPFLGNYIYLWRVPSKLWREEERSKGFCSQRMTSKIVMHGSVNIQTFGKPFYCPKLAILRELFAYFSTANVGRTLATVDTQCHRKTCLPFIIRGCAATSMVFVLFEVRGTGLSIFPEDDRWGLSHGRSCHPDASLAEQQNYLMHRSVKVSNHRMIICDTPESLCWWWM